MVACTSSRGRQPGRSRRDPGAVPGDPRERRASHERVAGERDREAPPRDGVRPCAERERRHHRRRCRPEARWGDEHEAPHGLRVTGLEQQGEIVRHAFLLRHGRTVPGAPPLATLESILPFKDH